VRNELGQHFVRTHGEKLDLTLEIDGTTVNATRTKKGSTFYTVNRPEFENPKEFAKLNGAIPDEVAALGLGNFQIADTTLDPVFASQADSRQFMLQETPMVLNAILGKFSSTERLEAGKREANTRIAEKNFEAKTIAKQVQETEELKAKLTILADRANAITAVVNALTPDIQRREEQVQELNLLISRKTQYEQLLDIIERLPVLDTRPIEKQLTVLGHTEDLLVSQTHLLDLRRITSRLVIPHVDLAEHQAMTMEQAGMLADSLHALTINRRWSAKTEEAIAVWTRIVTAYNLQKALSVTLSMLAADTAGKAREHAMRLDEMHADLNAVYNASLHLHTCLIAMDMVRDRLLRLSELNAQLEPFLGQLAALRCQQGEIEQKLEAAREAERQAKAVRCPHCGLDINDTTGEDHDHSNPISHPAAVAAGSQTGAGNRQAARPSA
jgi:DNA repair exonuclease SbcCD ATPase subunit